MKQLYLKIFFILLTKTTYVLSETIVVMLGTGTPVPDPTRAGSSVTVIYNQQAYVFDAGPGMVRNAIAASQQKGISALYPNRIEYLFLTHLHSDHILGIPALAATYWWRRSKRLKLYGPTGCQSMINGYYSFLQHDISLRTKGSQPVSNPTMYKLEVEEHDDNQWEFRHGQVSIRPFLVAHGDIEPAFGYRITTPDKVIVISGDTAYFDGMAEHARGADILIHEVICEAALNKQSDPWKKYFSSTHTLTSELARLANKIKPKRLILTHVLYYEMSPQAALEEVKLRYNGNVVLAEDLDIY
ncbi:MBL fold metallo-hydrolase [Endozoicomonadaceae bacterium StTr2]